MCLLTFPPKGEGSLGADHGFGATFLVTDPQKYEDLIKSYEERCGKRKNFSKLTSKIKTITEIRDFLHILD